jgi:hypothetical protein
MNWNAIKSLDFNDPHLDIGYWSDGMHLTCYAPGLLQASPKRRLEALVEPPMSEFAAFESGIYDPHITEADCYTGRAEL